MPTLAHTVGRLRGSVVRDLRLKDHGLSLVAPDVRAFAPSAGRQRDHALGGRRARPRTGCVPAPPTTPGPTRTSTGSSARSAGSWPTWPRRPRRTSPRRASATRSPGSSSGGRSAGSGGATAGPSCACSRWPWPTSSPSRSRPTHCAPRSRPAASSIGDGPWSAGSAFTLLRRLGRQRRRSGRPDGVRPRRARARWPTRSRAALTGGGRRDPHRRARSPRSPSATAARPGVVLDVGRGDRRDRGRRRHRPEAAPDAARRSRHARPDAAPGGPATSGRRARSPRSTSPSPACRASPAAGDDGERLLRGRILLAPGIDALERAFDASKYGRMSEHPMLEATIPSLVDPSLVAGASSAGARAGHVMSVIAQWMPYTPARRRLGQRARRARRPRRRASSRRSRRASASRSSPAQVITPARPGARLRPDRRPPVPRRARARPVLPVAAAARPRPLPDAARRAVPVRLGRPSRRRHHRRARRERRARDPGRREAPALIALSRRRLRRPRWSRWPRWRPAAASTSTS